MNFDPPFNEFHNCYTFTRHYLDLFRENIRLQIFLTPLCIINNTERGNLSSSGTYIMYILSKHYSYFVKMPCELYTNQQKCRFGIGHQQTLLLLWYRNIQKCNSVDCKVLQKCNDETAKLSRNILRLLQKTAKVLYIRTIFQN